jgi:hypothetical protein
VAMVQLFAAEIPQRATLARIMAAMGLLHEAPSSGAFLERPGCWVGGSCVRPLRRECKGKYGSDEKRKLCACHVARRPNGDLHKTARGTYSNERQQASRLRDNTGISRGGWPDVTPAAILTNPTAGAPSRPWLTLTKLHSSDASPSSIITLPARRQPDR